MSIDTERIALCCSLESVGQKPSRLFFVRSVAMYNAGAVGVVDHREVLVALLE